jgi:cytoskeleton protein RodZ
LSETVHSAPPAATTRADVPAGIVVVRASEPAWVEVHDARGHLLLSRTLLPGEAVGLDGPLPIKLVVGNAAATEVTLRGQRVVLGEPSRDNVVRLELR